MEFEIEDDPQGELERPDCKRDGGLEEDPVAAKRGLLFEADPAATRDRQDQSLIRKHG